MKPLGIKNYGSIGHLPGSRLGPGDHHVHEGQGLICTAKPRDRHDRIIVQEKLDGSNVGVVKKDGKILALSRSGYLASSSPYAQHHRFAEWVDRNQSRFDAVLKEGERLVGEWLLQAHGSIYLLPHEPFVAFDLMVGSTRTPFDTFRERIGGHFVLPFLVSNGPSVPVPIAMEMLGPYGKHGSLDPVEGLMYRVERYEQVAPGSSDRRWVVDFLAKFVRHDKADGKYLESVTGAGPVYNTFEWFALNSAADRPVATETPA